MCGEPEIWSSFSSGFHVQGLGMLLRRRGWKIDLRPLGEKQTLAWLPVCILALWLLNKMLFLLVGVLFVTAGEV